VLLFSLLFLESFEFFISLLSAFFNLCAKSFGFKLVKHGKDPRWVLVFHGVRNDGVNDRHLLAFRDGVFFEGSPVFLVFGPFKFSIVIIAESKSGIEGFCLKVFFGLAFEEGGEFFEAFVVGPI